MVKENKIIENIYKVNDYMYRGVRPDEKSLNYLASLGIKCIINLEGGIFNREPDYVKQEREIVEKLGLRFLHKPFHPIGSPSLDNLKEVLEVILQKENHPVYIHCKRGNDRTGIVIAAYRIKIEGWSYEEAIKEMKLFGHRSKILFWWSNVLLLMQNHNELK